MTKTYLTNHLNEDDLQWKTTSNGKRPPMEDNLKISKVEYLRNWVLDHTQILDLDLGDQSKVFKYFRLRWPPLEDDLKIFKVEHLSTTYWILLKF